MTIKKKYVLRHADEGVTDPNRFVSGASALESGRHRSPKEGIPGGIAPPLIDENLGVNHEQ